MNEDRGFGLRGGDHASRGDPWKRGMLLLLVLVLSSVPVVRKLLHNWEKEESFVQRKTHSTRVPMCLHECVSTSHDALPMASSKRPEVIYPLSLSAIDDIPSSWGRKEKSWVRFLQRRDEETHRIRRKTTGRHPSQACPERGERGDGSKKKKEKKKNRSNPVVLSLHETVRRGAEGQTEKSWNQRRGWNSSTWNSWTFASWSFHIRPHVYINCP